MNKKGSPWNWFKYEKNMSDPETEPGTWFDHVFSGFSLEQCFSAGGDRFNPGLDIQDSDSQYKIVVELPGVDEKDLEVYIEGDRLTIKGEKHRQWASGREQNADAFCRVLNVPDNTEQDSISASFNKGVLTLMMNKRQVIRPLVRHIEINKE